MGNSNQNDSINNYNHPRLGIIKRIQQPNHNQYMGYEIVLQSQKIYDEWQKELKMIRADPAVDQILLLPIAYSYKQTSFCGTGGIASLKYQDYLYPLLHQIINRQQIKRPFNQQELLYLFYGMVKISAILQTNNRVIGDVKPENILINQEGHAKIISQLSWPGQPNKLSRCWDRNERLFLSPQQCEWRQKKKQPITLNLQDSCSQAFSIALTILEAGTLKDCSQVYGTAAQYKVNHLKVREYLDIFQQIYSQYLFEIVRQMLHFNAKQRWKAEEAYKILKPYQSQIINLQQITIKIDNSTYAPPLEKEEKKSIIKIEQSHSSNWSKSTPNNENKHQQKAGEENQLNNPPENQIPKKQTYQSSIRFMRQNNNNDIGQTNNISGSTYHPNIVPNFQIINQNTNLGKNCPFQQNQPYQYVIHSLPLSASIQSNESGPQYLTQNQMFNPAARPLFDTSYALGNPRKQFY